MRPRWSARPGAWRSPAGRVAAAALINQGALPFAIDLKGSNFGPVREMIKLVRGGASLALTGDGPKGPVHEMKQSMNGISKSLCFEGCTKFFTPLLGHIKVYIDLSFQHFHYFFGKRQPNSCSIFGISGVESFKYFF